MDIESKKQKTEDRSQKSGDNIFIFFITLNAKRLAESLRGLYHDAQILKFKSETVSEVWNKGRSLIFIMATGIVVRTIAPLIKDKKTDPAVVVLDEKGKFAISLLSGHLGGANEMAREIAGFLGAKAVITTSSDINNLPSIDLWAKGNGLLIENEDLLPQVSTDLINNGSLKVYSDIEIELPDEFKKVSRTEEADIVITNSSVFSLQPSALILRPKNLVLGIGCNSGTTAEEIEEAVRSVLNENNLSFLSIHSIATIDIKANEKGLKEFSEKYDFKINIYTPDELNAVVSLYPSSFSLSDVAFNATGAYAVAEPAALLGAQGGLCPSRVTPDKTMGNLRPKLLVSKHKIGNVTVAVAEYSVIDGVENDRWGPQKVVEFLGSVASEIKRPKLYIVGTGPGGIEHITPYAQDAIRKSDVIVGYGTYLDLIKDLIKDKEVVSTGMTQEIDRCKKAVELALSGKTVSVISGGDPGIYAMAGLVFEVIKERDGLSVISNQLKDLNPLPITHYPSLSVEVIPGISALNACAARLGAPLMHDFAVISLSDRLTDWDLIEKRLIAAAMSDFVTVIYNPKSMGRPEHINRARDIFLRHRSTETPVGIVKGAMRENEKIIITNLRDMLNYDIDMQTTVIIGNSQTFIWNNYMITPRGYEKKFENAT
ncbi:precorrin-3B C(17)-methyltransferase [hot springs metagenome]|uniref:Precorrin-3B C(17)-methyltransferase n=1 Tax=hot springs metagenome TaxID=433727 RepID=A0A5J4KZN0_9ZZZZ